MKTKRAYLKGKSVCTVTLIVIGITFFTVFLTGENYNRSVSSNLFLSLSIIGTALFLFMAYGLYTGIGLTDNFPKFKAYKTGGILPNAGTAPSLPSIEIGDGIAGLFLSILLWIGMTILIFVFLIVLEAFFWLSIFIILAMLYWLFFRALKLVFSKSIDSKGDLKISILYSLAYSALYVGWIFGIVYWVEILA